MKKILQYIKNGYSFLNFKTSKLVSISDTNNALVLALTFLISFSVSYAQPNNMFVNTDVDGNYANKGMTLVGVGVNNQVFTYREVANATTAANAKFYQFNTDGYFNTWNLTPNPTYNTVQTATWFADAGYNGSIKMNSTTNGNHYTFNIRRGSSYTNQSQAVLETAYNPTSINSFSTPTNILEGQTNILVGQTAIGTVTLAAPLNTNEFLYVAWSTDDFASSSNSGIVATTFASGSTYNYSIPGAPANATVRFYPFTSISSNVPSFSDAPLLTLRMRSSTGENNTSSYASYFVANTYQSQVGATTWSNPNSWVNNASPLSGANVIIDQSIALDVDANVSGITVRTARLLTVNEGATLRISGSLSNNGTGAYQVNGTLQLDSGYTVGVSPVYGPNSILIYSSGGDPSRANEWPGTNSPASVIIQNGTNFIMNDSRSISKDFIVRGSGSFRTIGKQNLTFNGTQQTIRVENGGRIRGTDEGFPNDLIININNGSITTITGDATTNDDQERKFFDINVFSGGTLALSRGILCRYGDFTVEGTLQINANGYVQSSIASSKAAIYGATGKLIYNNGGNYTSTNFEWPAIDAPFDVTIKNVGTNVTLNGAKTINGTLSLENGTLTNGANLTMGSGATINRTGGVLTAIPDGTSYNVVYGAHTTDITTGFELPSTATVLNDLTISNGNTVTLSDSKVVNGNVNLTAGSFILGENTLNRNASGGSFTMDADTYLSIAGTQTFPSNYTTHSLNETSTVEYNGADQSITKLSGDYGHLILSNTGNKTLGTNIVAAGDFSLEGDVVSEIVADNSLTVGGTFSAGVDSDFTVRNNGYLIQTGTGVNTNVGSIKVNRVANIKRLDIVLWSSSVDSQNLLAFSPETLVNRFFQYNTAINNWNIIPDVANVTMLAPNGYAVRAPNNWSTSLADYTGLFEGVPNSGDYTIAFESSGQRFNLVGNPYPSTLNLRSFYNANNAKIGNTFYFYEHTQTPADTNGAVTNYGVLTIGGGGSVYVPATDSPQSTNATNIGSAESVQVGQGFFVRALADQSGSLTFNNSMRGGETNAVFFKNNMSTQSETDTMSLFRLRLTNPYGSKNQTVIGCFEDASDEDDIMDSEGIGSAFYSIYQNKKLAIQGRSLPLNQGSVIPLGYKASFTGDYTIDIIELTGIFQDQHYVILHDLLLGQYHNLSLSPYEFSSEPGTIEDRFQIVFTSILSNDGPIIKDDSIVLFEMNDQLHLHVKDNQQISDIKIYDMNGRLLFNEIPTSSSQFSILDFAKTNNLIIVKVTTTDSNTYTFKTAY